MKVNKPKAQKKDAKKAAKKELENNLSSKIFEVLKHFGQDAEKVGKDIELVSKFIVKKVSKKFKDVKSVVAAKIEEATAKPVVETKSTAVKKDAVKVSKTVKKAVEKAVKKAKPVTQSVRVATIATEKRAAKAIAKPLKEAVKTGAEILKPAVEKALNTSVKPAATKPIAKLRPASKTKNEEAKK
ncbi:hypothetical protein [Pedobacter sp. JCM 36344]|uniref:hypothetical protein n=1 Tax=Pedobacter sp. JCM 36344 TaxID=3374280 RepID=UPI00397C4707